MITEAGTWYLGFLERIVEKLRELKEIEDMVSPHEDKSK
jgi:hypothetical protein